MAGTSFAPVYSGVPRVNLMPHIKPERRQRASLWGVWGWAVVGALIVVALVAAGAFWLQLSAAQRLTAEQAKTTQLVGELSSLSDVNQALSQRSDLESFRASAMASDLPWSKTVASLVAALPPDVTLVGFNLTSGGAAKGKDPAAEVGLTGTLQLNSSTAIDIAPAVRAMRTVAGVLNADGQQVTSTSGAAASSARSYAYVVTVTLNQSIYSGTYAQDGSK